MYTFWCTFAYKQNEFWIYEVPAHKKDCKSFMENRFKSMVYLVCNIS